MKGEMGQSVIEINGTRYDASTGMVLPNAPTNIVKQTGNGKNIDGIVSSKPVNQQLVAPLQKKPVAPLGVRKVRDISMVHHHKPLKSKTLMRSVVKKPLSKHGSTHDTQTHSTGIAPSASYLAAQKNMLTGSHHVAKHPQINHFAKKLNSPSIEPTFVNNLAVAEPKSNVVAEYKPIEHYTHNNSDSAATRFVDSQLAKSEQPKTEKPKKKLRKRIGTKLKGFRFKSVASVSLAVLLIGGFLVYQNMPTISLVLANRASGISADMPKGIPSSFAIQKITAGSGSVFMQYDSRVDDREFTLTQVKSDTTVKTLEESIARTSNNQYQTYQVSGITLFMSPNDRVDWIDGEMRYNITGTTGFSPDQIAMIASSL